MLAIALEDPEVRNPCGYFGRLAGQGKGAADLRFNLSRILGRKGTIPPSEPAAPAEDPWAAARRLAEDLVAPPGAEDPKWIAIAGELKRVIREGKFGAWFSRVGFVGVSDGILYLTTPSGTVAERVRNEFTRDLIAAAQAADVFVERVVVTLRPK